MYLETGAFRRGARQEPARGRDKSLGGSPGTASGRMYMRDIIIFIQKNAELLLRLAQAAIEHLSADRRR